MKPMLSNLEFINILKDPLLNSCRLIHLYIWFMHLGNQLVFLCCFIATLFVVPCFLNTHINTDEKHLVLEAAIFLLVLFWLICLLLTSYLVHEEKKHICIAKVGINQFKRTWEVLSFARKHSKISVNQSAFTYCKQSTPSHLDIGKEQYHGCTQDLERAVQTTSCDESGVKRVPACLSPHLSRTGNDNSCTILKFNFTTTRIRTT